MKSMINLLYYNVSNLFLALIDVHLNFNYPRFKYLINYLQFLEVLILSREFDSCKF